jgi:pantetheine-phosphate adenylyltransferase
VSLSQLHGGEARLAIYPGTFDPVHLGHVDIARRAARLFEQLVVAVYDRPRKALAFEVDQRIAFFRDAVADLPNVDVVAYSGLTIQFARSRGAVALVRGLRTSNDYEFEAQLDAMNRHLAPEVDSVYLMTEPRYAHLSSSLIKEVAAEGADLSGLVPAHVAAALRAHFGAET